MNGRTYSVRMEGAKYGVSFGSALAIAISYTTNHSILWAIIHGDLQLVIRRLFRAIQDIETSIRERLSYRCSRQLIGDGPRTSQAKPCSLDAGAPEITSMAAGAVALVGGDSVLLIGGHGDGCRYQFLSHIRSDFDTFEP